MTEIGANDSEFRVVVPGSETGVIHLSWASLTDVGNRRAANEDSFIAVPPIFAVADGMGGHLAGDRASADFRVKANLGLGPLMGSALLTGHRRSTSYGSGRTCRRSTRRAMSSSPYVTCARPGGSLGRPAALWETRNSKSARFR